MVSYSDEPCLEMVIFLYVPSVLVWKCFVMDGLGGGGGGGGEAERPEHVTHVVYETLKQWKLLKQSSTNQTVLNAYGRP